jgi:hypothetical protein
MPLPLGEGSLNWCAAQDSNLQHATLEAAASADWATGAYPRQASNLHFPAFKAGPLPIGLRGQRMVRQARFELALLSF